MEAAVSIQREHTRLQHLGSTGLMTRLQLDGLYGATPLVLLGLAADQLSGRLSGDLDLLSRAHV